MAIPTFGQLREPILDDKGQTSRSWVKKFQEWEGKLQGALTLLGEIASNTRIQGRSEGIGTTVQNVDSSGKVTATGVGFNVDAVPDGIAFQKTTPVQVTGAGRAYTALDANSKLPGESAVPGMQQNSVTFAHVDGVDNGSSAGALIYGAGGPGTQWTGKVGSTTTGPFPSGAITGLAYNTKYIAMYDSVNNLFVAATDIPSTLSNYFVYCGTFTTPPSSGVGAAAAIAIMGGTLPTQFVSSVNVTSPGSGYTTAPIVSFTGGGGTGAAGYSTISGGFVTAVVMTNSGSGYSSTPTIAFSGGQGGVSGGGTSTGTVGGRYSLAGLEPA